MDIVDLLLGKPLATEDEKAERIGPAKGIPIFGLDALSSAAYGPEAALTLLIPLGMAGVAYILPIIGAILVLLGIVYFSYRQTMQAYPHGGGSYTVASENLGTGAGLLAAAALMIDYVLTAAVGISAGVGALVSAVPSLQPHTLSICLGILLVLAIVNLRGVSETGAIFLIPTYVFVACLLGMIAVGVAKVLLAGGHPVPVVAPPKLGPATEAMGVWLMLRAFSSGCTAMTGVEAVSNGVMAFREPTYKFAQKTLTIIIGILMVMLLGVAYLAPAYGVAATPPEGPGYESVLSQLLGAITGKGAFYWISIGSILLVLSLSANTAFADFPRLARAIAQNGFLPHTLTTRGRRLVFSQGVYALAILTGVLLTIFGGVTDRLIPLYAVGAFLAFTLSQAGMVVHWWKAGGPGSRQSMFINGLGAVATGITVVVVLIAKFTEGAWIVVVLIPAMILMMHTVKSHYDRVQRETAAKGPIVAAKLGDPIVVIPVEHWSIVSENALRFAWQISSDILIVHVECGDTENLCRDYSRLVEAPAKAAGLPVPELVLLPSPYRFIVRPILNYILDLEQARSDRTIAVLIPELV
ncbi:MAG TPA: APC family permease, partial [Bryobacteraceae bacterium]|nr:APC family permease [Bryobacteraceae bacterium]